MKVPYLSDDTQGIEGALDYITSVQNPRVNKEFVYSLSHQYDIEPTTVYIKSNFEPTTFELLLAYLMFKACEATEEEETELHQEQIKSILTTYYKEIGLKSVPVGIQPIEFDLYTVWEKWCGKYDRMLRIKCFEKDGLIEYLKNMLQEV
ncbi:hypothetical protein [Bacillus subtilis]|uniref:hypothetical protein n=1 Tax=Bacillus subtilis TaxID=1423 RepID=UPI000EA1E1D8|nr:hypothetical protein [Bacillus subtilis]AYF11336.1 hypothetical protein D3Z17_09525 [Bacillus subtilis]MCS4323942.1 hypothetical protein [Bacillus subtilis]NQE96715.1 hypothetical protein [Bacillus subtilis]WIW62958.1 hypothetical protein LSG27_12185 [Bacillus subtilis]